MHDEIEHAGPFEDAHALAAAHAAYERACDFCSRLIAMCVDDALARMRRLAAEPKASRRRLEVELRSRGLKLAYARRSLLDQYLHRGCIAERGAGSERITAV
jgi:hypothetical protein